MSQRPSPLVYAALIGQVFISAGTYLAARRAMEEIGPLTLVLGRFALSSSVFIAILLATKGPALPPRELWKRLLFLGLLCGPLNQGLFFLGLYRSNAAHAALLYALTPIGVYLVTMYQAQERFRRDRALGIGIAFAGVVVLLLGRGLTEAVGPLIGDLLILGAVAAWVLYTAEGKKFAEEQGPIRATAWTMVTGSLLSLPFAPFFFSGAQMMNASTVALLCVLFLGVVTSVVAYLLWYYALSRMTASRVAVFSNLQPVATAFAAWLVLGDRMTWEIFAGGFLVIAGVRLTQR